MATPPGGHVFSTNQINLNNFGRGSPKDYFYYLNFVVLAYLAVSAFRLA